MDANVEQRAVSSREFAALQCTGALMSASDELAFCTAVRHHNCRNNSRVRINQRQHLKDTGMKAPFAATACLKHVLPRSFLSPGWCAVHKRLAIAGDANPDGEPTAASRFIRIRV